MEKFFRYILVLLCTVIFFGCGHKTIRSNVTSPSSTDSNNKSAFTKESKYLYKSNKSVHNIKNTSDKTGIASPLNKIKSTEESEILVYEKVTGDNLTIGTEFAKDLASENFVRLLQSYQYDNTMNTEMASDTTQKTVVLHNARFGKLQAIKEPYSIAVEAYQYIMVPVVCSESNFNYQITFDRKQNIVGFSYSDYEEKEPSKSRTKPEDIKETEINFISGEYKLSGTLTTPIKGTNFPMVILVQGFGALDRDESIYENKPFRDIAWDLGSLGIATFRYDKRSYLYKDENINNTAFTIYEETIQDAVSAFNRIKDIDKINPTRIYLLGHSLGGYIMPLIAKELPDAAGYILMSAPAESFQSYAFKQYQLLAEDDNKVTKEEKRTLINVKIWLDLLKDPEKIPNDRPLFGAYKKYWIDLSTYNAIKTADNINKPVLVQQGKKDYQVPMKEFNIWKKYFGDNKNWKFKSYNNLNHFMMPVISNNLTEQYKTGANVDDTAVKDIVKFIKSSNKKQ